MNQRSLHPSTGRKRARSSLAPIALALAAVLSASIAAPATAAGGDALNVRFGGSLVGTEAYTTTEGEQMLGVLHRAQGDEEQLAGGGVKLTGDKQGIVFEPSSFSLGTDTASTPFVSEMEFTAHSAGGPLATLLSAGGNLFVRAKSDKLEYGFSSQTNDKWSDAVQTVELPALNTKHQLSVFYTPGDPATLNVSLDGEALEPATGMPSFPLAEGMSKFGFGNDVHPQGLDRGTPMTLDRVRVAKAEAAYDPSAFEFQPKSITTELLDVSYDGTFNGDDYVPAPNEHVTGVITKRTGAEQIADGHVTLAGNKQGLNWTGDVELAAENKLTRSFVAEAEFIPQAGQTSLGTLLGVGGNLTARYSGDTLQVGFSSNESGSWKDYLGGAPAPAADEPSIISLAYEVNEDNSVTMNVALNGVMLRPVEGPHRSTTSGSPLGTLAIGNDANPGATDRGYKGTVERTRFALLDAPFEASAFTLQQAVTPNPTECEAIPELSPANYITVSAGDCVENILAKANSVRPTQQQQDWQEVGLTGFIHYGINTYYDQEWGHGTEDPNRFNPTDKVDPDAWVRQLRDAGFRYAILTVKHHDGFLSYPSRYTDYDVASTPWLDGKGDVLREFTDAAHRYGMKVGLYMSPADSNQEARKDGTFGNGSPKSPRTIPTLVEGDDRAGKDLPTFEYEATDYGAYFLNTLYEILTEYGDVDEVWFDGAQGNTAKQEIYDYPAFYDMIGKLQPEAVVAVGGRDVRWVGNEKGQARNNEWGPVAVRDRGDGGKIDGVLGSFEDTGSRTQLQEAVMYNGANALHWWPTESDMKLTQGWFAHPNDVPKNGTKLLEHYEQTVGRNSVMLLNVPPTTAGTFAQSSVDAINSFAAERRKAFTQDHALGLPVIAAGEETAAITDGNARTSWWHDGADSATVEVDLGAAKSVKRIALGEDTLAHGQTIESFHIEAEVGGSWKTVASSGTIGVSRIVTLPEAVTAQKFRVVVDEARGSYSLANLSLYEALATDPGTSADVYVDCAAPVAGAGSEDRPFSSLEQFRDRELTPGTTVHLKSGVDCAATSTPFWGYGTDSKPVTITTYGGDVQPRIGDVQAGEFFAEFAERGWVTDFVEVVEPVAPTVTATAATVTAGGEVNLSLTGFAPEQEIALELHSTPVPLGSATPDEDGAAEATVTIPAETVAGAHEIVALQGQLEARVALEVLPASDGSGTEGTDPDGSEGTDPDGSDGTEGTDPDGSESVDPDGSDGTEGTDPDGSQGSDPGESDGAEGTDPDGSKGSDGTDQKGAEGTAPEDVTNGTDAAQTAGAAGAGDAADGTAPGGLANTGAGAGVATLSLAGLLLALGATMLVARRRRAASAAND